MLFLISDITESVFYPHVLGYYRGETEGFLKQATLEFHPKWLVLKVWKCFGAGLGNAILRWNVVVFRSYDVCSISCLRCLCVILKRETDENVFYNTNWIRLDVEPKTRSRRHWVEQF